MPASPSPRPRAILVDALDTLVRLEKPAPFLEVELRERLSLEVTPDQARAAIRAEIAHYRANLHRGRDVHTLAELRRECALTMLDHLPPGARDADVERLAEALVASIRFTPFPEVPAALGALRERGLKLVVLSNWDVSLHEMLETTGLDELVDAAVSSAEHGIAKPDPAIFLHAAALAGVSPHEAWHVGDSHEADVVGARAAGIRPLLVSRDGTPPPDDVEVIADLSALVDLVDAA